MTSNKIEIHGNNAATLMDKNAAVSEVEVFTLSGDTFDRFISICDAAEAPNNKLRGAFKLLRGQYRSEN